MEEEAIEASSVVFIHALDVTSDDTASAQKLECRDAGELL